jgi:TatD DNase family protein
MEFIDTHCHLTDLNDQELNNVLLNAKNASIKKILCVGASNGLESNFTAFNLSQKFSQIFCSIGLHPHDADKYSWTKEMEDKLDNKKVLAIGETGLDFFKDWSDFSNQRKLFIKSISIAKSTKKPLIIHCRSAHEETLEILRQEKADHVGGVFHCFGETLEVARKIIELGFLISVTGIITFKNSKNLREVIKNLPLNKIMLETDSPYMAPEPFRGKKSEPAHVKIIAETLANLHNVSIEKIAEQTSKNAEALFNF